MNEAPANLVPDPVLAQDVQLHRALGPVHLTLIGIGATIGAGIFVIAGNVAAEHAGPAVLLSFVIAKWDYGANSTAPVDEGATELV